MSTFLLYNIMVSVVVDNFLRTMLAYRFPEKEYGPLEHILVPKMKVWKG